MRKVEEQRGPMDRNFLPLYVLLGHLVGFHEVAEPWSYHRFHDLAYGVE